MASNNVKFFKVNLLDTYLNLTNKDNNALYWVAENQTLYLGSKIYGTGQLVSESAAGLLSPEDYIELKRIITSVDPTIEATLAGKVDKIEGYSLIADTEIARLAKVDSYDDMEVRGLIQTNIDTIDIIKADYLKTEDKEVLQTQINTIMNNPDTENVINSINEFTQYVKDHGTIAESMRADINKNKKDIVDNAKAISDALIEYKTNNDIEVAKKANSEDVYSKSETYTKSEIEALFTWGEF